MTNEQHAVYAVLDTIHGTHKVRVSDHVDWNTAQDMFDALELDPRPNGSRRNDRGQFTRRRRRIVEPGYTVYDRPVRFFAVRSSNDPDWPASASKLSLRCTITGERV